MVPSGGFTLNSHCAKPWLCPGGLPLVLRRGQGANALPPWSKLLWAPSLHGPLPAWDQGAPSKTGFVWEAFGQMRRFCRDKMPKAGGLALVWPVGQELKCWDPGRPSLPGPLSGGLGAPRSGGHPHPSSDPRGAAGTLPVGPLLHMGWELPPLVQATACLRVPCGWGLCQLQAPTVHPEGARPRPQPAHTETTWRGCNRHGSGETGETGVWVAGPAAGQMDGWDVTATPSMEVQGSRPPGETKNLM